MLVARCQRRCCWLTALRVNTCTQGWSSSISASLGVWLGQCQIRRLSRAMCMDPCTSAHELGAVLQQVLQHSHICTEQRTFCRLLCTSKTISTTIREHCSGRIRVDYGFSSLQQVQLFARWLHHHGKLLQSLCLRINSAGPTAGSRKDASTSIVAEALRHAAAAEPVGLLLQNVQLQDLTCTQQLLQQLQHSRHLTSLDLRLCQSHSRALPNDQPQQERQGQWADPLIGALSGLASLQHLVLHSKTVWGAPSGIDALLPALSALTQLTDLRIDAPHSTASLQHIPQQLQQLHLVPNSFLQDGSPEPLQLSHVTALTVLDNSQVTTYSNSEARISCRMVLTEGDQLPNSLHALIIKDAVSAVPFRQLQQLQKLVLSDCSTSAADLQLIAAHCKQLQDVLLWYVSTELESCAAAWQWLPLTGLHISACDISADTLQHVSGLHKTLKCLDIRRSNIPASVQQTAWSLAQLTGLQTLQLNLLSASLVPLLGASDSTARAIMPNDQHETPDLQHVEQSGLGHHVAGSVQYQQPSVAPDGPSRPAILHAIAGLPNLTSLMLSYADHRPGIAGYLPKDVFMVLGSVAQLTSLQLCRLGIDDKVLVALVSTLTRLQHLVVTHAAVTDACLSSIAANLHDLRWLDLTRTNVTEEGLQQLQLEVRMLKVKTNLGILSRHLRRGVWDIDE